MRRDLRLMASAGALVAVIAGGTGMAAATGHRDDGEPAITGPALERAEAAALAHTGGGRVTGTEVGDEESFYEVEVTLDDSTQVDVQLDRAFTVVGDESDDGEDD